MEQQVLVAAFPDVAPEVHIASADRTRLALVFHEAGVTNGGAVDIGRERLVALADIGSVQSDGVGVLTVCGQDRKSLVQMHFEEAETHRAWTEGLRKLIGNGRREQAVGGSESDGGDAD